MFNQIDLIHFGILFISFCVAETIMQIISLMWTKRYKPKHLRKQNRVEGNRNE